MSYYIMIECQYVKMDDDSITVEHTNEFGLVDEYEIPYSALEDRDGIDIFADVMELSVDVNVATELGIRDGVI